MRQTEADANAAYLRRGLTEAVARICPSWLAHEREDLVQAALVKVMGLHGTAAGPRQLTATYLWKTAYTVMLDEIRRARWRFERQMEGDETGDGLPGRLPDPERSASARQIGEQVRACLCTLDAPRRRAVVLHLSGFGHAEAADMLGKAVKQVDNLIHRGMQDLRHCLREKGVTP